MQVLCGIMIMAHSPKFSKDFLLKFLMFIHIIPDLQRLTIWLKQSAQKRSMEANCSKLSVLILLTKLTSFLFTSLPAHANVFLIIIRNTLLKSFFLLLLFPLVFCIYYLFLHLLLLHYHHLYHHYHYHHHHHHPRHHHHYFIYYSDHIADSYAIHIALPWF